MKVSSCRMVHAVCTIRRTVHPISLYLHIPFCRTKCPFCHFNTFAQAEHLRGEYVRALSAEIASASRPLSDRQITTLYFGGGTPTLLSPHDFDRLLAAYRSNFHWAADPEITCEAHPGTVDAALLRALFDLGVNRLSLGVQSLTEGELVVLGRDHDVTTAREAYRIARQVGFENINLDFMYAIPGQTLLSWRGTLAEAISWQPEHISCYALSFEEGTPFYRRLLRGELIPPDDDLAAEMYIIAKELLDSSGYRQYEISNWAQPGFECRHNLTYWRNEEFLGCGAGAHSYLRPRRFWNVRRLKEYMRRALAGESPVEGEEIAPPALEMAETLILGLRLNEGLPFAEFTRRFGVDARQWYAPLFEELAGWGLLTVDDERVRLTQRGQLLSNEVFVRLLPDSIEDLRNAEDASVSEARTAERIEANSNPK